MSSTICTKVKYLPFDAILKVHYAVLGKKEHGLHGLTKLFIFMTEETE